MTILKAPKMLGRKGSMDRRPLARRRSSGFDRYSSKNHSSNGGAQWCCSGRACGMIVMAALVGVMLCSPLRLGSNMVLSINISPRDEKGNSARLGVVRGLTGMVTGRGTPPEPAGGGFLGHRASETAGDRSDVGNGSPSSAGKKLGLGAEDLCLSMAVGISPEQLVAFAASFREVAPLADLVMFFEAPTSELFNDIIDKFAVTPLEIERNKLEPAALRSYHPTSVRWIMYQRFLELKGSNYERVLMASAGQTFFQKNPFDVIGDPGFYTFTDDSVIGECQQHSTTIKDCLGVSALDKVADKPAVHSAVSLGTGSFAVDYARQMSEGLLSQGFQACEAAGVDTGLHNHLVYGGAVSGVLRFDQASGPMTDVQAGKFDISASRVMNLAGKEVPIVYRYVGNEALKRHVFKRYIYWTNKDDGSEKKVPGNNGVASVEKRAAAPAVSPNKNNANTAAATATAAAAVTGCEQYALSEGVDLFKAKCDLATTRVDSIGSCCSACSGRGGCRAFSFDKGLGLCYMKNCGTPNEPGPSSTARSIASGIKSGNAAV